MSKRLAAVVKLLFGNPSMLAALVMLQVLLVIPLLVNFETFATGLLSNVELTGSQVEETLSSDAVKDFPEYLVDYLEEELAITKSVVPGDDRSHLEVLLRLSVLEREEQFLHDQTPDTVMEDVFISVTSSLLEGDWPMYHSSRELPGLAYLSYVTGVLPEYLTMVPSLLGAFTMANILSRKRLLFRAPIPTSGMLAFECIGAGVVSICLWSAAMLPGFLYCLINNGIGSASYPVSIFRGGVLIQSSVGMIVGTTLGSVALCAALLASIHALFARAGNLTLSIAVPLAVYFVSWIPGYVEGAIIPGRFLGYLPSTYFRIMVTCGYFNYSPMGEWQDCHVQPISLLVPTAWVLCCCLLSVLMVRLRTRAGYRHVPQGGRALSGFDISVTYDSAKVLDALDIELHPGQVIGLIAPNGTGKTTLLEVMACSCSGNARGIILADATPAYKSAGYHRLVYLAEGDGRQLYPWLSATDHLALVGIFWNPGLDIPSVCERCCMVQFATLASRKFSQGMVQQLVVAMAISSGSSYVLLDEPFNALDPGRVTCNERLIQEIAADGRGVLISAHQLDVVDALCEEVVCLVHGKAVAHARGDYAGARTLYFDVYGDEELPEAKR